MAGEVLVPVLLHELQELEVVLHLALDKGLDADGLINLVFGEGVYSGQYNVVVPSNERRTLQYLEILQVCIFCVGVELDSRHGHIVEDAVENLTECGAVPCRQRIVPSAASWPHCSAPLYFGASVTYPVPHCSTFVMLS